MARTKKAQVENTTAQAAAVENASKAATLCAALKTFCNSLAELAKQAGRTDFTLLISYSARVTTSKSRNLIPLRVGKPKAQASAKFSTPTCFGEHR